MTDLGLTWGVLPVDTFERVLVFSPHFDDAAMGAGHLLLAYRARPCARCSRARPTGTPTSPRSGTPARWLPGR